MTLKTIFAALVLALAPSLAAAACWEGHAKEQAMTCAEGSVWDAEQATCVEVAA